MSKFFRRFLCGGSAGPRPRRRRAVEIWLEPEGMPQQKIGPVAIRHFARLLSAVFAVQMHLGPRAARGAPTRGFGLWSLLTLVCAGFGVRPASAAELAGATLRVARAEGAEDCPDESALARSIAALGGASGAVRPGEYVATIQSTGRKTGVREIKLRTESCGNLAEATSVALAVLLDLVAESKDAPAAPPESAALDAPPAPRPKTERLALGVGIQSGAGYGLLGEAVSPLLGGRIGLGARRVELVLAGVWIAPRDIDHAPGSVEVGLAALRLDGCWWSTPRENSGVGMCLGLSGGRVWGEGAGFDANYAVVRPWLAAAFGASLRARLTVRVALRFALSALVPLHAETFSVTGSGPAYETLPLAAVLETGPELSIW
jgi:hypothetical protein